jgi:hypothetical protein
MNTNLSHTAGRKPFTCNLSGVSVSHNSRSDDLSQPEIDVFAIMPKEPIQRLRISLRQIWPAFAVGLGLASVLLWVVFLGWALSHAVLLII